MKNILFTACLIICATLGWAQQSTYSRVRIFTDDEGLKRMAEEGVTVDHGLHKRGVFFESDFSGAELEKIRQLGLPYTIQIEDVKAAYKNPSRASSQKAVAVCSPSSTSIVTPQGFGLGSMGGFYTYQEMLNELDSMKSRYPNLISMKSPADVITSIEGRPIYYVRISDNASTDEPEPEMLYTALHHAREPAGMQQLIFYMHYLLENYATDPEIQAIINNTELYFIPCINPDGYIENELTDPTGGGMWRKNRRNNGDGTYGIDLNRNYGYNWGYDNTGSSPSTSSDVYRGTSGFSEPETQVIRNFTNAHEFKIAINYHTYGNLLVHPWGYGSIYTPDSAIFTDFATALTRENNYLFGTSLQTVGYVVNGGSDDWMYGDTSNKPKVFSFTPEAGDAADGFWPASFLIEDICKGNITQNLTAANMLLRYALVADKEPQFISQPSGHLNFSIKRLGLDSTGSYTVTIVPLGSTFTSIGSPETFSGLQLLETKFDSISYTLASSTTGQQLSYVIQVNNGLYTRSDTVTKYFGQPAIAYSNQGNTMSGLTSAGWGTTNEYAYSPSTSITDSPYSNYNGNTASIMKLSSPVSLFNTSRAVLRYNARWEIEEGWDYAQVQISTDNGMNWISLCGKFTKPGSQNQDPGQPLYDGTQILWVNEEIDLSAYINQNIQVRFVMISDGWLQMDGFYVDDLVIERLPSSPISVEEQSLSNIRIYPNPTTGDVQFEGIEKGSMIRVYSSIGQLVHETTHAESLQIDLSNLESGVYAVEVVLPDGKAIRNKLMVY